MIGNEIPFHLKPIPYRGVRKHQAEVLQHPPGYQHPIVPLPPCSAPNVTAARPDAGSTWVSSSRSPTSSSPAYSVKPSITAGVSSCSPSNRVAAHPTATNGIENVALLQLMPQHYDNPRLVTNSGRGGDAFLADAQRLDPNLTADVALRQERARERGQLCDYRQARRERAAAREAKLQAFRDASFEAQQRRLADAVGTARGNREQDDRDPITHQCYTLESKENVDRFEAETRRRYFARQRFLDQRLNSTEYNILSWKLR
ncbi:hypothetical protein JKF63_03372 [Porcisia hertigi]|uniref:Uncharacterized protein n=1 Tax=Porcisia hertigi TaxID=2761500 RepID=A0A836IIM7_9TRYP|nr:hypothetical protein JKF63_03372 [Porcisia hertigi]